MWKEVQDGELGRGQVEVSVRDRGGKHEGEGRSGEEGGEAGDPSPAAQGDPGSRDASDTNGGRFYDLWVKDEFTTGAWYGEPATMYTESIDVQWSSDRTSRFSFGSANF